MVDSFFLKKINSFLDFSQKKFTKLIECSWILSNIDKFIGLSISLTVIVTTFVSSDIIGICALSVIVLTILKLFISRGQKLELSLWNAFLPVYFFFCIISTINSTMPFESLLGLFKTFIYLGFYFSAIQYFKHNAKHIIPFILLICAVIFTESVIGIFQQQQGVLAGATWQDTSNLNPNEIMTRVFGSLNPQNPNLYGGYILCGLWSFCAMALWCLSQKRLKHSIVFFVGFAASIIAVFLSGCRGTYLGVGIFCTISLFGIYRILNLDYNFSEKFKKLWWALLSCIGALIIAAIAFSPAILKRILSIFIFRADSSSSFRMNVYQASFEMFKDNILLGIGCGNKVFREIYGLYMMSGFDALSAYCVFLEIGLESGIFALISFLLFLFFILKNAWTNINERNKIVTKILSLFIAAEILAVMTHGLVDTIFFRPQIQILFWISVAILSVCRRIDNYEIREMVND